MTLHRLHMETPIGVLTLVGDDDHVVRIDFPPPHGAAPDPAWRDGATAPLLQAHAQLTGYFAGTRQAFDLPLAPRGTPFQRAVWAALAEIPFGQTWSYRALATRIGNPAAVRAVGGANGRNPLPIVLPCHRVIGADGTLTGFGGGLPTKAFLLRHEGVPPGPAQLALG